MEGGVLDIVVMDAEACMWGFCVEYGNQAMAWVSLWIEDRVDDLMCIK